MRRACEPYRSLALATLLLGPLAHAATATPGAWKEEDTLDLRRSGPRRASTGSPSGSSSSTTGLRPARHEGRGPCREEQDGARHGHAASPASSFDRVEARRRRPRWSTKVAAAMGEKYWSDVFIRYFDHPLTLQLARRRSRNEVLCRRHVRRGGLPTAAGRAARASPALARERLRRARSRRAPRRACGSRRARAARRRLDRSAPQRCASRGSVRPSGGAPRRAR